MSGQDRADRGCGRSGSSTQLPRRPVTAGQKVPRVGFEAEFPHFEGYRTERNRAEIWPLNWDDVPQISDAELMRAYSGYDTKVT